MTGVRNINKPEFFVMVKKKLVNSWTVSYTLCLKLQEVKFMKRILFTIAVVMGLVFGGNILTTSDVQACGGKDKGATTEQPSDSGDSGTQS